MEREDAEGLADFLPSGEELSPQAPPQDRKLFTGQAPSRGGLVRTLRFGGPRERDFETGLDYFSARMLRPDLGGFLTPDPLGVLPLPISAQDFNAYDYVVDNPLSFVDPSGLAETDPNRPHPFEQTPDWSPTSLSYLLQTRGDLTVAFWTGSNIFGDLTLAEQSQTQAQRATVHTTAVAIMPDGKVVLLSDDSNSQDRLVCAGTAYVIAGNSRLVGRRGGFARVTVTRGSAAVVPRQFTNVLRAGPLMRAIGADTFGTVTGVNGATLPFNTLTDTVGYAALGNAQQVQDLIMARAPGQLVLEIVGGRDLGSSATVIINMPALGQGCPVGTFPLNSPYR